MDFKKSKIEFYGRRSKSLFGHGRFSGKIKYDGLELDVDIELDNENSDFIEGWTNDFEFVSIGRLYADSNFTQVTICIYEEVEYNTSTWNSDTGLMFSYPAINRNDALNISNTLVHRPTDFK